MTAISKAEISGHLERIARPRVRQRWRALPAALRALRLFSCPAGFRNLGPPPLPPRSLWRR
eukprot:12569904-Heterocapsa_arctica.AAC.1